MQHGRRGLGLALGGATALLLIGPVRPLEAKNPALGSCAVKSSSATIRVDGKERSYLIHVASQMPFTRPPLILAFHGRGETPALLET